MKDKESPTIFFSTRTRQQGLGTLEITRNSINGDVEFEVSDEECDLIARGTFKDLFELILLGKLHKAQLQAMDKKEPVVKCDLCPNPAEWFESPLGNPDEPKMCSSCYRKHVEPGARDWDTYHIPRKVKGASKIMLCDLCGKLTTGQNPHYDCAQREAYLANGKSLIERELLNNEAQS